MIKIVCSVYEKYDFLEILEYAKKKKIEDCNNNVINPYYLKWELEKLETLKKRVNGIYKEDYDRTSLKYQSNISRESEDTNGISQI